MLNNKYQFILSSYTEMRHFYDQCRNAISEYGVLTYADALKFLGNRGIITEADMRIGWFDLGCVTEQSDCANCQYIICFPDPINLSTSKGEALSNVKRHAEICKELTSLYERKNHDYGDAFHDTFLEEGFSMARVRLSDKLNRFKTLSKDSERAVTDESIRDTLVDLANYAIMTIMEMDRNDQNN